MPVAPEHPGYHGSAAAIAGSEDGVAIAWASSTTLAGDPSQVFFHASAVHGLPRSRR